MDRTLWDEPWAREGGASWSFMLQLSCTNSSLDPVDMTKYLSHDMQRLYTGSQYDVYPKWFNSYVIFGSPEIFVPLEWNCKSWNELSALKYGSPLPHEVCTSLSAERCTRTNKMAIQSYRCHNTSPRWIQMTKAVCIILQILELSLNYDQIFNGRFFILVQYVFNGKCT